MGKSEIYHLDGKLFRYDFDNCVVEYVHKATEEDKQEEAEWLRDHDRPLYGIDADGYMTLDSAGLSLENWQHKGLRREYLSQWIVDLDEEARALARDFEKYELPYMMKQMEEQHPTMNSYYYTFGCSDGFPYKNGWVVVKATSWEEAHQKFRARFPDRHENTLNCSFFYDEEKWAQMDPEHRWTGWKLHEVIE